MNKHEKCDLILARMSQIGYDVVDNSDMWDEEECEYFIVNYEESYLKEGWEDKHE